MLQNLKISTKIIAIAIGISLIGLVLSSYAAWKMHGIDDAYSDLIAKRNSAVVLLVRAGKNVAEASYASYKTLVYDGNTDVAKVAAKNRADRIGKTAEYLDLIREAYPDEVSSIDALKSDLAAIASSGEQGVALGLSNEDESAKPLLAKMDEASTRFDVAYGSLRDKLLAQNMSESDSLTTSTWATIHTMIVGSAIGLALGIGGAIFVSTKGIAGPLKALGVRMEQLAGGKLDVDIAGQERRDEVGTMAKAVQVFKEAANENKRLEAEAKAAREAQASQ
ncbi:MAG: HAMP domain-containing protein, partial [Oxalobacteraceae bacterium]